MAYDYHEALKKAKAYDDRINEEYAKFFRYLERYMLVKEYDPNICRESMCRQALNDIYQHYADTRDKCAAISGDSYRMWDIEMKGADKNEN